MATERRDPPAALMPDVPLYQPGDTKLLRITLTEAQWSRLAARSITVVPQQSLEAFVNEIVREEADRG